MANFVRFCISYYSQGTVILSFQKPEIVQKYIVQLLELTVTSVCLTSNIVLRFNRFLDRISSGLVIIIVIV